MTENKSGENISEKQEATQVQMLALDATKQAAIDGLSDHLENLRIDAGLDGSDLDKLVKQLISKVNKFKTGA